MYNWLVQRTYVFVLGLSWVSEWVIIVERQLSNLSTISWWEQVIFNEMIMMSALFWTSTLSWIFIVLAHWDNSPRVDMSLHSDTLSHFLANQSLLFLLNTACLAEKQEITML